MLGSYKLYYTAGFGKKVPFGGGCDIGFVMSHTPIPSLPDTEAARLRQAAFPAPAGHRRANFPNIRPACTTFLQAGLHIPCWGGKTTSP